MLINIVALLAYISIHTFYCPRMGRTLIKKWHLFMRITMPVIYERRERSNDEEIHDLINLIKNYCCPIKVRSSIDSIKIGGQT